MPLLNYTTKVPVTRTIGEVQSLLVQGGARAIMAKYNDMGTPDGIAFQIETAHGTRTFTLPVNAERVLAVIQRDPEVTRRDQQTPEHAERVAWRILKDWLEAQLAIIRTEMVTLEQVMLPYMHAEIGGRTFYDLYVDQQLSIGAGSGD